MIHIPMPTAGDLREPITIEVWQDIVNANAGIDQTFTAPIQAWARVEPVGAAIYHGTAQTDKAITHRFYIRFIVGINTDHVITHNNIRYRIKRSQDLAFKKQFLMIEAEQLGAI